MTDRDELRCAEGTSRCPICGIDTPHKHSAQEVREWRESEAWVQKSWEHFQEKYADKFRAAEMAGDLRRAEQWLRSISEWLLTTDNDMRLPDGILDTDPLDLADMLSAIDLDARLREARREALEEAAKVAAQHKAMGYMSDRERSYCHEHGEEIAEAIRALSEGIEQ